MTEPLAYLVRVKEKGTGVIRLIEFASLEGYILMPNQELIEEIPLYEKPNEELDLRTLHSANL